MPWRNAILSATGAILVGGLVYLDRLPALHDVPLLGLVLVATLVSLQEFTRIAARKALYLPISAMNLAGALVGLFVYYFREPVSTEPFHPPPGRPEPLLRQAELAMSLLMAVLTLVLTTTLITYVTTRRRTAGRELLWGAASTAYLAGGLSYALLLEYLPHLTAAIQDGLLTLIAILGAVWGGEGLASLMDRLLTPAEPAAEPSSLPWVRSEPSDPAGEATRRGRSVRRRKQRPRSSQRPAPPSKLDPASRESRPLWQQPLVQAAGVFLLVVLGRNFWGLEFQEAVVGGLGAGGVLLAYRFFQRTSRSLFLAATPRNGTDQPAETAPLPRPRTLAGAAAGIGSTVLIFDLLGERWLGLDLPHALLTGLAIGLASRAGGRILYALKRAFRVRETGSLLTGYGGLLDRLSSLFLALPAAYYSLCWLAYL